MHRWKIPFLMKQNQKNKWMEAALVKTVTVASDVGAFHDCVEDEITGILCKDAKNGKMH